MLERFLSDDRRRSMDWDSLTAGAPTVLALARLASDAWLSPRLDFERLSIEARALLFLAKDRGILELRGTNDAFDSADRLLMVHVELGPERIVVLRTPGNARGTMKFLEGFKQLCEAGLVLHHMQREFSLTERGFELSRTLSASELEGPLQAAQPVG